MFENLPNEHAKKLNTKETIPTVCTYVNNFREQPLMKDHVITQEAFTKHQIAQNAKPVGEKH